MAHALIQDFCQGSPGSPGPTPENSLDDVFSVYNLFYSLQFQRGSNVLVTENTILFQESRGGPTFSRGVQLFSRGGGGVQKLISIETHIAFDNREYK